MKQYLKYLVFIGFSFFVLWGSYVLFFWIDRKQEQHLVAKSQEQARLSHEQVQLLEEGDIILRRGYGYFSDIIATKLNDSLVDVTHVGILTNQGGEWSVIHSLSSSASDFDGVQEQSLHEFLLHSVPDKIIVVRVRNVSAQERANITKQARIYLERRVPFDELGVIDDASKLYCTELVWQILENDLHYLSLPQEKEKRKALFYSMKGLYNETYFEKIINTYEQK